MGIGTGTWVRPGCPHPCSGLGTSVQGQLQTDIGLQAVSRVSWDTGLGLHLPMAASLVFSASLADLLLPLLAAGLLLPSSGSFLWTALLSGSRLSSPPP